MSVFIDPTQTGWEYYKINKREDFYFTDINIAVYAIAHALSRLGISGSSSSTDYRPYFYWIGNEPHSYINSINSSMESTIPYFFNPDSIAPKTFIRFEDKQDVLDYLGQEEVLIEYFSNKTVIKKWCIQQYDIINTLIYASATDNYTNEYPNVTPVSTRKSGGGVSGSFSEAESIARSYFIADECVIQYDNYPVYLYETRSYTYSNGNFHVSYEARCGETIFDLVTNRTPYTRTAPNYGTPLKCYLSFTNYIDDSPYPHIEIYDDCGTGHAENEKYYIAESSDKDPWHVSVDFDSFASPVTATPMPVGESYSAGMHIRPRMECVHCQYEFRAPEEP